MNIRLECVRWRLIACKRDVAVRLATKNATGEGVSLVQLTIGQKQRASELKLLIDTPLYARQPLCCAALERGRLLFLIGGLLITGVWGLTCSGRFTSALALL